MDKFDRIFERHRILSARRTPTALENLLAKLECSRPTLFRVIALMKDRLNAPIAYDAQRGGYLYDHSAGTERFELPGLKVLTARAAGAAHHAAVAEGGGRGPAAGNLKPVDEAPRRAGSTDCLRRAKPAAVCVSRRSARAPRGELFSTVASATLQRQKLFIEYHARSTDTRSERTISPQRITHYRDTWYLDAWDDDKDALRSFSIDRIRRAVVVEGEVAFDVEERELDEHYASAYGIFGGKADKVAVLRFSAERARWVADETWHPQQEGKWLEDGRYELRIPYRESRELVMDVLRHGAALEVVSPRELRASVFERHTEAAKTY